MTWRIVIAAALASYSIAAYAAWEIVRQVSVVAAVWTP
jgi:hypothetical protein